MKNNKKIALIILLIIIVVIISIFFASKLFKKDNSGNNIPDIVPELIDYNNLENAKMEDGIKKNISENVKKDHISSGIKISNMETYAIGTTCYIKYDIENVSYTGEKNLAMTIAFFGSDGNNLAEIYQQIPKDLPQGVVQEIETLISYDATIANDYIVLIEEE